MQSEERVERWAEMEGKSDTATEDLLQQVAPRGRDRSETKQLALGVLVVLAFCTLSLWGALTYQPTMEVEGAESGETLAENRYHFRP